MGNSLQWIWSVNILFNFQFGVKSWKGILLILGNQWLQTIVLLSLHSIHSFYFHMSTSYTEVKVTKETVEPVVTGWLHPLLAGHVVTLELEQIESLSIMYCATFTH